MEEIFKIIKTFRTDRLWHLSDTPASMAKSIIIEAAELLENFQWSDTPNDFENVKEELADILIYTFTLCEMYQLDIYSIIKEKLLKNEIKYPKVKK